MIPRFLGRARTLDGAPKGKRPNIFNWTSFQDLLCYREEQLLLLEAGKITRQLFRTRVRRWARRWHEQSLRIRDWEERDRLRAEQQTTKGEPAMNPDTPEQNTPPPEYSGEPPLPEEGPIAEAARPATVQPGSPLERLPESVSAADVAAESRKYGHGGY